MIPLPLLFAKPAKDQVRLSPLGKWLGYRSRDDDTGVLNLWIRNIKTGQERQLTFERERDVCLLYWFTYDDRSIVFLREPNKSGSELYHLYAIDLIPKGEDDATTGTANNTPRDLIDNGDHPTTCAMGFAGGLQVWLDPKQPRLVYVATAPCGLRSMFWSISRIHIDTGESTVVAHNPLSTWGGLILFAVCSVFSAILRKLGLSNNIKHQPRATVQWFPDQNMNFRGRLELSLVDLSCAWRVRSTKSDNCWKILHYVTWANANMSLVGSTGGSGTAHFDFGSPDGRQEVVDLHVCDKMDTTSYERYQIDIDDGDNDDNDNDDNVGKQQHVQHLASHPKSDITGFLMNPKTKNVEGVIYNYEKPIIQCLEDCPLAVKRDIDFLQKEEFPQAAISIVSRTLDDQIWLVHVQSDVGLPQCNNSPSGYFVVNRNHNNNNNNDDEEVKMGEQKQQKEQQQQYPPSYEFLLSSQPDLAQYYPLGTMTAVHIPARDGEDLLCYLSRPPSSSSSPHADATTDGCEPRPPNNDNDKNNKTPLVILVHGGPQARDVWQFHPICQLLCARGMSVLQINYRGSTGMGARFIKLGMDGQFAKGVQDDIEDAASHAIAEGWCHPDKLAIMGGSFGGYSALAAMTFRRCPKQKQQQSSSPETETETTTEEEEPDYKCAVAICPPSIMGIANPHKGFYGNPIIAKYWRQVYGSDVATKLEASKAVSPLFHLDKMNRPLLLFHGEDDPRVPIEQTNDLYNKLLPLQQESSTSASGGGGGGGVECDYIRFAGEGHGIRKEQNILYMYHKIECFLCRHLGLPDPPALEDSWIKGHTGTLVSRQQQTGDKSTEPTGKDKDV